MSRLIEPLVALWWINDELLIVAVVLVHFVGVMP